MISNVICDSTHRKGRGHPLKDVLLIVPFLAGFAHRHFVQFSTHRFELGKYRLKGELVKVALSPVTDRYHWALKL
jgi:hypothetical protein